MAYLLGRVVGKFNVGFLNVQRHLVMLFVLRGVLVLPAGSLFKGCVTFSLIKHLVQISSGSYRFNEQRP